MTATYTYTTISHPKSGETYAVKLDDDGNIVAAAGPLDYSDSRDEESIRAWIANAEYPAEDAEWLTAELSCDYCGHFDTMVMATSTGTACPNCYDRMS